MENKTKVKLIGEDGNIFNLVGIASRALIRDGKKQEAEEMKQKVFSSHSYHEALSVIMNYCEVD